jgi:hypothetical protein
MVQLTLDKPYTVHCRSVDRLGATDTAGAYKLNLRDPIKCADDQYIKCTMVSARMPSTFYSIDKHNNTFTLEFNKPTFSVLAPYINLIPTAYRSRSVTVTIQKGNYDIESLLTELVAKANAKCTAEHVTSKFRTYMRSADVTSPLAVEDIADSKVANDNNAYREVAPQFGSFYSSTLNKVRLFRKDAGGLMVMGAFDLQTSGVKLGQCLGFNHVTAQVLRDPSFADSAKTSVEQSVHYRGVPAGETEFNDFTILTPTNSAGYTATDNRKDQYGNAVLPINAVNMFANDTVYMRFPNLPSNAYETLYGGQTNVMAVIPLTSGTNAENFHVPSQPTSTNIGKMGVSELDVRITDAMGAEVDFNGGEHEFQLVFEAFSEGTRSNKPPDGGYADLNIRNGFANLHNTTTPQMQAVNKNPPNKRKQLKPHRGHAKLQMATS